MNVDRESRGEVHVLTPRKNLQGGDETKELQADITRWAGVFRPFIPGERLQEDINHIKANRALASQIEGIFKKYSAAK